MIPNMIIVREYTFENQKMFLTFCVECFGTYLFSAQNKIHVLFIYSDIKAMKMTRK